MYKKILKLKDMIFQMSFLKLSILWSIFCILCFYIFLELISTPTEISMVENFNLENENHYLLYKHSSVGGFPMDGQILVALQFEEDITKKLFENQEYKWEALPYKPKISKKLFFEDHTPVFVSTTENGEEFYLPWVENGYYILLDKTKSEIKEEFMWDYDLYVYDKDEFVLYFLKSRM